MTGRRRPVRVVAVSVAATASGSVPVFTLGAASGRIRADLGFDARGLGLAVAVYFAVSSLASVTLGRRAQSRPEAALAGSMALILAGLVTLAASPGYAVLLLGLALGGLGNAVLQPSTNTLLAGAVVRGRQGIALGAKQAGVPAATLLGGLAVPLLVGPLGWRATFLLLAVVPLGVVIALRPRPAGRRPDPGPGHAATGRSGPPTDRPAWLPLTLLTAAAAFAAATAGALGTFTTTATVDAGLSVGAAGLVQALGSGLVILSRLGAGAAADRRPGSTLRLAVAGLVAGAAGFLALAFAFAPVVVPAILVAYALGWAWPGLLHLTVVQWWPASTAAATGVTQAGVFAGTTVGPLAFGLAYQHDPAVAWTGAAVLALAAAGCFAAARHAAGPSPLMNVSVSAGADATRPTGERS